jgi:hypothetical protein
MKGTRMTNGAESKSRIRGILFLTLYLCGAILISGMIYFLLDLNEPEHTETAGTSVDLEYLSTDENGFYMFQILVNGSSIYSLHKVNVSVYREVNEIQEIFYDGILLSSAYSYHQDSSLDQKVTYNDLKNDWVLSTGDTIFIWIDPSMSGDYTVELNSIDGEDLASFTFEVK